MNPFEHWRAHDALQDLGKAEKHIAELEKQLAEAQKDAGRIRETLREVTDRVKPLLPICLSAAMESNNEVGK